MKKDTRDRSEYQRKRREMFPELFLERHRAWRKKNPEKHAANGEKWRKENLDWYSDYARQWRKDNPEKCLQYCRRSRGLPEPTRPCPEMCELCGGPPNGKGSLHLDHCHKTGKFRGWLCYKCNSGLGKFGDDKEGLLKAIAYLDRVLDA